MLQKIIKWLKIVVKFGGIVLIVVNLAETLIDKLELVEKTQITKK